MVTQMVHESGCDQEITSGVCAQRGLIQEPGAKVLEGWRRVEGKVGPQRRVIAGK